MDPIRNGNETTAVSVRGRFKTSKNSRRVYPTAGFLATDNLEQQSKAEDLVRKYVTSSVRRDRWIPAALRTLDRAQSELQHDGLAVAISASEYWYTDLAIWQAYSPPFARSEAWKNIEIGVAWIRYLRRKGEIRS
jgi:hypothetical protein